MTDKSKTYRVFPDYCADGVWGEVGSTPYTIEYDDLKKMGASDDSIRLLKKMQYVFEMDLDSETDRPKEEVEYINWCAKEAARRLTEETGCSFRGLYY